MKGCWRRRYNLTVRHNAAMAACIRRVDISPSIISRQQTLTGARLRGRHSKVLERGLSPSIIRWLLDGTMTMPCSRQDWRRTCLPSLHLLRAGGWRTAHACGAPAAHWPLAQRPAS